MECQCNVSIKIHKNEHFRSNPLTRIAEQIPMKGYSISEKAVGMQWKIGRTHGCQACRVKPDHKAFIFTTLFHTFLLRTLVASRLLASLADSKRGLLIVSAVQITGS